MKLKMLLASITILISSALLSTQENQPTFHSASAVQAEANSFDAFHKKCSTLFAQEKKGKVLADKLYTAMKEMGLQSHTSYQYNNTRTAIPPAILVLFITIATPAYFKKGMVVLERMMQDSGEFQAQAFHFVAAKCRKGDNPQECYAHLHEVVELAEKYNKISSTERAKILQKCIY